MESIEFIVECSNEEQSFKEYKSYNYSIRKATDKKTKELIKKMKQKHKHTSTVHLIQFVQQQIVLDE